MGRCVTVHARHCGNNNFQARGVVGRAFLEFFHFRMTAQAIGVAVSLIELYGMRVGSGVKFIQVYEAVHFCLSSAIDPISDMTAVALGLLDQASLVVNPGQGSALWVFQIIDIRVHDRVAGGAEV